ncbi:MAG: hypothetical protein IT337_02855 [Thermomicrobiales bacterium]|nr:hypothetical protein [Thermomicrobiales bacterium]
MAVYNRPMQTPPEPRRPFVDLTPAGSSGDPRATELQRSLGPSFLLSLVITFLLLLALKRVIRVGPMGMAVVALVVWALVLALLVRGRATPERRHFDE